jgi:preprotein translocase subunit SecD
MERTWYLRLALVVALIAAAWFTLWPSLAGIANNTPWLAWLAPPSWVTDNIDRHITPGLDIQGGLRMMYTVDMNAAVLSRRNARVQSLRRLLIEKMTEGDDEPEGEALAAIERRFSFSRPSRARPGEFRVQFRDEADVAKLDRTMVRSLEGVRELSREGRTVALEITDESIERLREHAVGQAQETIKNRITEMGILEANVRSQDIDIIVEVPGASQSDFDRIREIISQTAHLEFQIVDDSASWVRTLEDVPDGITRIPEAQGAYLFAQGAGPCPEGVTPDSGERCKARTRMTHYLAQVSESGRVPEGRVFALGRGDVDDEEEEDEEDGEEEESAQEEDEDAWRTYVLHELPPGGGDPVGGAHMADASVGNDPQSGEPLVLFEMNPDGARRMQRLTSDNTSKRMAIVLDGVVQSAPAIRSTISARGQIELGGFRDYNTLLNEANDLVIVLRAGALAAPIVPQNEQLIGPTLGRDSVAAGAQGALIGIGLVLLFMILYYQVAGLVADMMVLLNLLFLFALMAFFNNDLTLPGIAGIALTVGMAVDANVLITERMREELRLGKSPRAAVDQGYRRAFWSIFDGQITTAFAGIVLLQFGSPELQGFAKTLLLGIITSLFTGVFCSKVMFDWLVRGLKVSRLRVG